MSAERDDRANDVGADHVPHDSWFEPAPPVDDDPWAANGNAGDGTHATDWFLRTGRAGLLPGAMTVSWDDGDAAPELRQAAAGAPPWVGEKIQTDGEPPPWESGPWSGPGEEWAVPRVGNGAGATGTGTADRAGTGNWQSRAALVTGILPLVLPGVVLGVLGLRQARLSGSGRAASWLGVTLSVVWAIVLGVMVFGSAGSSSAACSVPGDVRASYRQVMKDLGSGVAGSALAAQMSIAASRANAAAAYAQQVRLRSALFALASDLEVAQTGLAGHNGAVASSLRLRLAADGSALTRSCAS